MPNTYVALATQTIAVATSTVTFTSIPQGYTDLVLVVSAANASASNLEITFNSDTGSNYSRTQLAGNGSSATSARESNYTSYRTLNTPASTSTFSIATLHIMNYSNTTTNKTLLDRGGLSSDSTYAQVGLYRSTSAISTIRLLAGANFSVGSTFNLYGIANADLGAAKATGGIITEDSQYWYHTFGASGAFIPKQSLSVDYLIAAGGGGAGGVGSTWAGAGGGGGGQILTGTSSVTATNYSITVGAGGTGGVGGTAGSTGGTSTFNGITSSAGLGGLAVNGPGNNGGASGSGFTGGIGNGSLPPGYGGGGGGGNSANGVTATSTKAGDGGAGTASSISGSSVTYGGGGGGGLYNGVTSSSQGLGVDGGANGNAWISATSQNGNNAVVNRAGGGGGAGGGDNGGSFNGGNGGSGIVVIRYAK
jgi:hypothetical protein